jgi:hypothetical protein
VKLRSMTLERLVVFLAGGAGSITISRSPVGGAWQVDAARRELVGGGDLGRMAGDAGPWASGDVATTTRVTAYACHDLDAAITGALDAVSIAEAKWPPRRGVATGQQSTKGIVSGE